MRTDKAVQMPAVVITSLQQLSSVVAHRACWGLEIALQLQHVSPSVHWPEGWPMTQACGVAIQHVGPAEVNLLALVLAVLLMLLILQNCAAVVSNAPSFLAPSISGTHVRARPRRLVLYL